MISEFENYVKLNKKIPPEILTSISAIDDPGRLADTIAAHAEAPVASQFATKDAEQTKRLNDMLDEVRKGDQPADARDEQHEYQAVEDQVAPAKTQAGEGEAGLRRCP